jgi:hypothetical protein
LGVLRDSQNFKVGLQGSKHLAFGVFFISLKRYENVDVENELAWAIWTYAAQVRGKRMAGSQIGSLIPDH